MSFIRSISRFVLISLTLLATAGLAQAETVAHPAIPEVPASTIYQVRVDGIPVPINDESLFRDCRIGGEPVDGLEDININEFVSSVKFEITDP